MNSNPWYFWVLSVSVVCREERRKRKPECNIPEPSFRDSIHQWEMDYTVSPYPGAPGPTCRPHVMVGQEVAHLQCRIDGTGQSQ